MRLLGAKLREARRRLGLTRAQVVERAQSDGLHEQSLATIESQREVPCDEDFARSLARALECTTRELLAGDDGDEPAVLDPSVARSTSGARREPEHDARGPLDRAMDLAFDPRDHIAQDRFSVEAALRYIPVGFIAPKEIVGVARAWLDAAAVLREHGVVPTFTTLVACVAALEGFPAEHAQRLLVRAKEAGALEGEPQGGR